MLQLIVLLSIGALWAITSLLSREAQPLPARQARGPGPSGLRPSLPMNPGGPARTMATTDGLTAPSLERRAPARWNDASPATRSAAGRGLGVDDGIVILESDSRAPRPGTGGAASAAAAAKGRAGLSRRTSRGRSTASQSPSKSVEPGRPRALTTFVAQSMAQKRTRPLEITPLAPPLPPINSPLTQLTFGAKIEHPGSLDSPPAFTAESLQSMLANPTRLLEAALLTELLQPPLALRRLGRRR